MSPLAKDLLSKAAGKAADWALTALQSLAERRARKRRSKRLTAAFERSRRARDGK